MIKLSNISKNYLVGKNIVHALNNVSFEIAHGDFLALRGPSGCGKTTLLNILGLLDTSDSGEFLFEDIKVSSLNDREKVLFRKKHLGFIFQHFNLIPELNVFENIEIPLLISRVKNRKEKVMKIIEDVGLLKHVKHKPFELSGGQMQRVSIARALVKEPSLVLADEPTANLDSKTGKEIMQLLMDLNKNHSSTILIATHDAMVLDFIPKIISLLDGEIINTTEPIIIKA